MRESKTTDGAHDVKAVGYAWAAFDDLRKERDEAVALLRKIADSDSTIDQMFCGGIAQEARQFLATLDRTEKP
jgi:hypothetical protein